MKMARHHRALDTLRGPSTGMISLPKSFHNLLTSAPEISESEIENMSVSQLLERSVLHQGFAYKRTANRKTDKVTTSFSNALPMKLQILSKWQLRYLIIYSHYVVYYKDDTGKKPVGWFTLKDYNRVIRAEEMISMERKHPFKVIGMKPTARTWYFCAASEREMKLWMACFKATMDHAIHGKVKQTCLDIITTEQARCYDESSVSASSNASSIEENDETYEDLERPADPDATENEPYDEIGSDDDDESLSSGGGSGGTFHPRLSPMPSVNAMYQIETITGQNTNNRDSYFATQLEYMAVLSDHDDTDPCITPAASIFSPVQRRRAAKSCQGVPTCKRINSDPQPRQYRNHSPDISRSDSHTTPRSHRRLPPTSPGSRPKFPEPEMDQENYDVPDVDKPPPARRLPQPPPPRKRSTDSDIQTLQANLAKQFPKPNTIRREPEGNSFRQPMRDVPKPPVSESSRPSQPKLSPKPGVGPRPVLPTGKPSVPSKPLAKPSPPSKPSKPLVQSRNLLPDSAIMKTSDKSYAEDLLEKHQVNGMYLIRPSGRDVSKKVVMVWHDNERKCKHYTIFDDNQTTFALDQTVRFGSLLELIEHYKTNCLPNSGLKLSMPCPG